MCDNYRIGRNRIYGHEKYRGYKASKRCNFSGLKLHLLTKKTGLPVEFLLSPAVETAGSLIERILPKSIHAVNAEGFELKVMLFVLGLSIDHLLK